MPQNKRVEEPDPMAHAAAILVQGLIKTRAPPEGWTRDRCPVKATWCFRELFKFMLYSVELGEYTEEFAKKAREWDDHLLAQAKSPPPPRQTPVNDAATQTPPPPQVPVNDAATQTPPPLARTYAETATQATTPPESKRKGKGKEPPTPHVHLDRRAQIQAGPSTPPTPQAHPDVQAGPSTATKSLAQPQKVPTTPHLTPETPNPRTAQARAVVLHAAPTKFKPGQMRRWIEENNKGRGQILGIRWLVQEHRRAGKLASSLVIYMKERIDLNQGLRMGKRLFRITGYDWDR